MDKKEAKKVLENMIMVAHESMGDDVEKLQTVQAMRVAIACIDHKILCDMEEDTESGLADEIIKKCF